MVRRAIRPGVAKLQEASLRFAEGDLLDAMGQVDQAFEAYQRANAAQGMKYDAAAHEAFVDGLIGVFTPELFASMPKPSIDTSASILVCGMPRSGKRGRGARWRRGPRRGRNTQPFRPLPAACKPPGGSRRSNS